jgi:DNA-binding transcriptional LysR family regulator
MEDYKLKVFCTVAEVRSFSKASEIIHLTQPAVSSQIKVLEEFYGTKLFERTTNNISLTPGGEILYKYAKDILTLYADAEKNIGRLTGLVKGGIRLGACSTIGSYLLPRLMSQFHKKNPLMKFTLYVGNTRKVVDLLTSSGIDIGFVEGEVRSHKINSEKVLDDELHLVVSASHRWASQPGVPVSELESEPMVLREEGSGTRQSVERFLTKNGLNLGNINPAMVLESIEAIKEAVETGVGVSFLSMLAVGNEVRDGRIKIVGILEDRLIREYSIIYRKKNVSTHAMEEFISFIKQSPTAAEEAGAPAGGRRAAV